MKRPDGAGFTATLDALLAVTATSVDIMILAQPSIARDFMLDEQAGSSLVAMFAFGYGSGQILWGALSDRFGRQFPHLSCHFWVYNNKHRL